MKEAHAFKVQLTAHTQGPPVTLTHTADHQLTLTWISHQSCSALSDGGGAYPHVRGCLRNALVSQVQLWDWSPAFRSTPEDTCQCQHCHTVLTCLLSTSAKSPLHCQSA